MYTIIEDCSPYYIRFKWEGLQEVIDFISANAELESSVPSGGYSTDKLPYDTASKINEMLPFNKEIALQLKRFWIFTTYPDGGSGIHKDSSNHRMSINIPLQILDDKCTTTLYSDEIFKDTKISNTFDTEQQGIRTRNVLQDWHVPSDYPILKTFTARADEAVLLNTEIWHNFWNKDSTNTRKILTMRVKDPGNFYFDDAKKVLFGI